MEKSLAAHGLGWHSRHYQCGDYDKAWTEAGRVLFTVVPVWNKTLSTTLILFTFLLVLGKKNNFGRLSKGGGVQTLPPVDPPVERLVEIYFSSFNLMQAVYVSWLAWSHKSWCLLTGACKRTTVQRQQAPWQWSPSVSLYLHAYSILTRTVAQWHSG